MMLKRVYRVMINEDFNEDDRNKAIADDWISDTHGGDTLSRKQFGDAFFEMTDLWTAGISAHEYAAFLKRLSSMCSHEVPIYEDGVFMGMGRVWKPEEECNAA